MLQNPRAAFASTRVEDEIALALELRGEPREAAKARTLEIAERIGVTGLLDRNLSTLSAGEATLVAIAVILLIATGTVMLTLAALSRHRRLVAHG